MKQATAKFLFDEDFAASEKPTITLVEHERRRADAESVAYRNGFAAGHAQATKEATQHIANTLDVAAGGLAKIEGALQAIEARLEIEAVQVAVAVASKLAPELIAREPMTEITALATDCFRQLVSAPNVVVHVGADIHEATKEQLTRIAAARGFEGRLIVHPDPQLAPGDCRMEWAEGGITRDEAATRAAIDELVGRYISARGADAQTNAATEPNDETPAAQASPVTSGEPGHE